MVGGIKRRLRKVVVVGHGVDRVWFSRCRLPRYWRGPCLLCEERRGCGGGIKLRTWTNVDSDDDCVVTVWTTWHVRWHARSSPSAIGLLTLLHCRCCWHVRWWFGASNSSGYGRVVGCGCASSPWMVVVEKQSVCLLITQVWCSHGLHKYLT